jgi:predicted dehydrogenase
LEDSLFSITAAAGAAYVASTATLAEAQQPIGSTAANDKIGVAVIGVGGQGGGHVRAFMSESRCTILYLVDPDTSHMSDKLLDDIAATQGGIKPKRVADMRKAFEDKSLDAICCASPNHWHALTGIWALQAGKHAFIEKPLCHNIMEGLALEAAVKKYKKVIQTGTQCRSIAANADIVKFVHDGGIGEVKFARGLCFKRRKAIGAKGNFPIPQNVDYDLWSGPAPIRSITREQFHYDWHWQRLYGNGDLGNQGPHQTDIARWFLGLERYPNTIMSYGGRLGYDKANPDDDPNYVDAGDTANTCVSLYDYGDKCIVFETRGLATPNVNIPVGQNLGTQVGVIAYGTKGYAIQGSAASQVYHYSAAYDLDGNLIKEFKGGGSHHKNFLDAVVKNDPAAVAAPAACGALSAAVSHLGNISYYLGESNKVSLSEIKSALKGIKSLDDDEATLNRTVEHLQASGVELDRTPLSLGPLLKFDSGTKRFIGNEDANAMLTREYRVPYVVPKPENV